jgi:hypothetical protein
VFCIASLFNNTKINNQNNASEEWSFSVNMKKLGKNCSGVAKRRWASQNKEKNENTSKDKDKLRKRWLMTELLGASDPKREKIINSL